MKKLFTIFTILSAIALTTSCQKELPDAVKNVDVNKGGQTLTPENHQTPTPENPTQGDIPTEEDNPWPGH